jgi:glycosyltransferase involved in cell wall biosynthesis
VALPATRPAAAAQATDGPRDVRSVVIVLQSTSVGGMETHCRYHVAELRRRGLRVDVVVPEAGAFDDLAGFFAGGDVVRLDTDARRGRPRQLLNAWRLLRAIHRARADVVHLHTGGATGGLFVVAAARLGSRATVVITEHDVPAPEPRRWDRFARAVMDRLTDCVVAVSQRNASLRVERLGRPRVRLARVLNGVPVPALSGGEVAANRREVRDRLDIPADAVVLGSLVRLAPGKGLTDLLRAFARLPERGTLLLLVGDGPLRDDLDTLARELDIADRVRFAGHQPDPAPFLDAMDVFVLAVPAGSMSIALLETMGRGLPPVITFCGPEEAVQADLTGLCAPPSDPVGLATSLARLTSDAGLRQRLGLAAADHVASRFSAGRVADDLMAVYRVRRVPLPDRLRAVIG